MQIRITAINDADEKVSAVATSERDVLAMAILRGEQGFTDIRVTDSAKTYTAEEYAAKVINV
jgi:hypothetical protein